MENQRKIPNILKEKGFQGIFGACIVLSVLLIIVSFSKLNDIRHQRLPMMWRRRLRNLVSDSAKHVKLAETANDIFISYHHAVAADAILKSAKNMVGDGSLRSITGYNTENLEGDIDKWLSVVSKNENIVKQVKKQRYNK